MSSFDIKDVTTWPTGLIVLFILFLVVFAILFLVTIIWFVTWIKYSWFTRENSANLSGDELSKKYLQTYGINARKIKFKGFGNVNSITVEPRFFI